MDVVVDRNARAKRRTGAHGTIKPTSAWDFAVDVGTKGEKRQLLGKAGDFDVYAYQRHGSAGGRYSVERRQPRVYNRPFVWDKHRNIGRIPSVIQSPITTGPTRTLSPQISIYSDAQNRSNEEKPWTPSPDIQIAPTRRIREDALKNLPWMYQKRYLANFPLACEIRQKINRLVRGR